MLLKFGHYIMKHPVGVCVCVCVCVKQAKKLILDMKNKRHKIKLYHENTLQAENVCSVNTAIRYDYNTE